MESSAFPLRGLRVLVTRPREDAQEAAELVASWGGIPVVCPLLAIAPLPLAPSDVPRLQALASYDLLLLTSRNAVRILRKVLPADVVLGTSPRVACVGPRTAEAFARTFGRPPDLVAEEETGEGLAQAVLAEFPEGSRRAFFPRARKAREVLPERLRAAGWAVDEVVLYDTLPDAEGQACVRNALAAGAVDVVLLFSPSAVDALVQAVEGREDLLRRVPLASIGPVTTRRLEELGITPVVQPEHYTAEALVAALARAVAEGKFPLRERR
ncbi:MAG: Uroporphyrinogen-III methyltransferase [Brockia lithotrophica]|uniref:Uroporphyrinogen-III synthase n=1 Tax=Brockia lithotrophica TaxID=933949 RepID=A0A2T5G7H7_9BACL|nr:MAG: Uroporphyrinogen-III methyltransferase [Brockia lithotrophica]